MSGVAVASAAIAIGVAVDTGTTLAIVAAVGATISAVGVVTHNQTLAIAGGVIGAVGAIGGLASAAGVFDGASGIFSAGTAVPASAGADVGTLAADAGAPAVSATDQALIDAGLQSGAQSAGISSSVTPDIVNMATGEVSVPGAAGAPSLQAGPAVNSADPTVGALTPNVTPTAATNTGVPDTTPAGGTASGEVQGVLDQQGDGAVTSVAAPAAPAAPTSTTGSILNGGQGVTGVPAPSTQQALVDAGLSPGTQSPGISSDVALGGAYSSTPSAFSGVLNFLGKNGTLASGAIQAGAALIAGATSSLTPAQVAALNAQANANQAAANLSTQQLANIRAAIPTASRAAPAGLINSQAQTPAVTGAPA